jgi:membrane protein required for colicin V production
VTKLDYIVLALLLISAVVGFARGAAREIAAMAALIGGAAAAIFSLEHVAPIAGRVIHTHWMAVAAALALVFAVVYVVLRLLGARLAEAIHGTNVLGALDRTAGLLVGLVRGLVVLGALYLMFNAATPPDLRPRWIVGASTWPLAADTGRLIEALEPRGLDVADRLTSAFARGAGHPSGDRTATEAYDARRRGEADELLERSR